MIMTTWSDIKNLAADLQRVQLGEVSKKLSENNCIEVVNKLIDLKLINVLFTVDGKEYVTRQNLTTEIKNECIGTGGRVELSALPRILNIEYGHIEDSVNEIVKNEGFILCVGQLISRDYLDQICTEINERLTDEGQLTISQISKSYDLPSELIRNVVYNELGGPMFPEVEVDKDDSTVIHTKDYLLAQKALVRGALSALTKVTSVQKLLSYLAISPSLFFQSANQLLESHQLAGRLTGGRNPDRALYIPRVYSEQVQVYVLEFFCRNDFVEFTILRKMGIFDCMAYLKECLTEKEISGLVILESGVIGAEKWLQLKAQLDETIIRKGWADVQDLLPENMAENADVQKAIKLLRKEGDPTLNLSSDGYFYTNDLVAKTMKSFEFMLEDKVQKETPNLANMIKGDSQSRKELDSGRRSGKRGVKKGKKVKYDDYESATTTTATTWEFLNESDLGAELRANLGADWPDELMDEISDKIRHQLNADYRSRLEAAFLTNQQDVSQQQKKAHSEFRDRFATLYSNICLFDAGAGIFVDSVAIQLRQYLLRTLCSEAANLSLAYISGSPTNAPMSAKIRESTINALGTNTSKEAFSTLFVALAGKKDTLDEVFEAFEMVGSPAVCGLNLRPPDKRKTHELLANYSSELRLQLATCTDPTTGFLLILLILIATFKQVGVHASGKFVLHLIDLLKTCQDIARQVKELTAEVQQLVVASFRSKGTEDEQKINEELDDKFEQLKKMLIDVE